jgi:hypothetical protein
MDRDTFQSSRDQLSKQLADLERQAKGLHSRGAANSPNREQLVQQHREAVQLKSRLEETVRLARAGPTRSQITPEELESGQTFLSQAALRLNNISQQLQAPGQTPPQRAIENNPRFIDSELESQTATLARQDEDLDTALELTSKTKVAATVIGHELADSNRRLAEIDVKMDTVLNQFTTVNQKMKDFLARSSTWLCVGCIILTVIAVVLVSWVILQT